MTWHTKLSLELSLSLSSLSLHLFLFLPFTSDFLGFFTLPLPTSMPSQSPYSAPLHFFHFISLKNPVTFLYLNLRKVYSARVVMNVTSNTCHSLQGYNYSTLVLRSENAPEITRVLNSQVLQRRN